MWKILGSFILLIIFSKSFAATAEERRSCFRLLVTITSAQKHIVERLSPSNTLLSAATLTHMRNADSRLIDQIGELRDVRIALDNLFTAQINHSGEFAVRRSLEAFEEASNDFVARLALVLDRLNINYEFIEKAGGNAIKLLPNGNLRINRMVRRAMRNAVVDIYIDPMHLLVNRHIGSFSEGRLYLSLDSILRVSSAGQVINFLRPTGVEWHEFMHAILYTQRLAGNDDEFDIIIRPIQNFRSSNYPDRFAVEEIPIHHNQLQFLKNDLKNLREALLGNQVVDLSMDSFESVINLRDMLQATIAPLSRDTFDFTQRTLGSLDEVTNVIRLNEREYSFFSQSFLGDIDVSENVLAVTITSDTETATLNFHNQFSIRRFNQLRTNADRMRFVKQLVKERLEQTAESMLPFLERSDEFERIFAQFMGAIRASDREAIILGLRRFEIFINN